MELVELVKAVLRGDMLTARRWVMAAGATDWSAVSRPAGLTDTELAVAASLAETFAERAGGRAPAWSSEVGSAPEPVVLAGASMRRLRARMEREAPEPVRRRRVYAPRDFLVQV